MLTARTTTQRGVWVYLPPENRKKLAKAIVFADSSYRQLADAVGWKSHSMVTALISGRKNSVKNDNALLIARHLEVDVNDLFVTRLSHETRHPVASAKKRPATKKVA